MEPANITLEPARSAELQPVASDVQRLVAAWLLSYDSANTRKSYGRDLAAWFVWCAEHDLDPLAVARGHLDAYARHLAEVQHRSPATVARRLSALAQFYAYATDEGLIERSPAAKIRRPKVADDSQTTGLDRDQLVPFSLLLANVLLTAAAGHTGTWRSSRCSATTVCASAKPSAPTPQTLEPSEAIGFCASPARADGEPLSYSPRSRLGRSTTSSPGAQMGRCS
jgi:hypothetical protein